MLRLRPPFPHVPRITGAEVSIAGGIVPANSFVLASALSAHHDERYFTDPERLDLDREPNRQLAFGHGIHFCLGAPPARLETEIALNRLLDEFAELRLGDDIVFHETELYGPEQLPLLARR